MVTRSRAERKRPLKGRKCPFMGHRRAAKREGRLIRPLAAAKRSCADPKRRAEATGSLAQALPGARTLRQAAIRWF